MPYRILRKLALSVFFLNAAFTLVAQQKKHVVSLKKPTFVHYDTIYVYDTVYVKMQELPSLPAHVRQTDSSEFPFGGINATKDPINSISSGNAFNSIQNKNETNLKRKGRANIFRNLPSFHFGNSILPFNYNIGFFYGPVQHNHTIKISDRQYDLFETRLKNASTELTGNTYGVEIGFGKKIIRPSLSVSVITLKEAPNLFDNINMADTMDIYSQRGILNNWTEKSIPFVYDKMNFIEMNIAVQATFTFRKIEILAGPGITPSFLLKSTATYYENTNEYFNNNKQSVSRNTLSKLHFIWNLEAEIRYYLYKDYYVFFKPCYSQSIGDLYSHPFLNYGYQSLSLKFGVGYRFKGLKKTESMQTHKRRKPPLPKPQ